MFWFRNKKFIFLLHTLNLSPGDQSVCLPCENNDDFNASSRSVNAEMRLCATCIHHSVADPEGVMGREGV